MEKNQDSGCLWGRTEMSHERGHQDTLATAHRPLMNLDDDSKDVHIVITKSYHHTVCTVCSEYILDDKKLRVKVEKEHNLHMFVP